MWVRDADDTIRDQDGKVIYFGLERFVRDLCLGDCCFICGVKPGDAPFNDEHVIPKWILRRYNLFDRMINLPNGTTLRYGRYTVPCCEACNTLMGRMIEEPIRQIVEAGSDAVVAHLKTDGVLKFYVWIGLIFLKTHLKDRRLRAHLDQRKGFAAISEDLDYDWAGLHYLHTLVRCFATDAGISTSALGSLIALPVQPDASGISFDFGDLYQAQTMMLRLDDFALLACFNDGMCAGLFLKQKTDRITGPVSDMQLRELITDLSYINLHLKNHVVLQSSFDLKRETHVVAGTPVVPELSEQDRSLRGQLMHYFFRDRLPSMRSHRFSNTEIERRMLAGELTFLFDEEGAFFKTSDADSDQERT